MREMNQVMKKKDNKRDKETEGERKREYWSQAKGIFLTTQSTFHFLCVSQSQKVIQKGSMRWFENLKDMTQGDSE
jgi:hypothetical protein